MKRISKLLHLLLLLIFMSVFATEVRAGAFYVWCEGNATLYFLNSEKELKAGDSYDGQTITNVWNDPYTWEGDGIMVRIQSWSSIASKVNIVVFDESFKTVNITETSDWFSNFKALKSFTGLEYLNTSNVTDMIRMFNGCSSLTAIDLSHFDTSKVTDMAYMFDGCSNLKTIFIGDNWNTSNVTYSSNMFRNCNNLVGQDGTSYDNSKIDVSCAHADAGGYMTRVGHTYIQTIHAVWCESNTTLYFLKSNKELNIGDTYDGQTITNVWKGTEVSATPADKSPKWVSVVESEVTKVVFDKSFQEVSVHNTSAWFKGFNKLVSIIGIEYLNTAKVNSMAYMFSGCSSLKSLDLSHFDTGEVTDMSSMFRYCSDLTSLDLTHFDTSNVTNMAGMFEEATGLTILDLSHFDTGKVTNMAYMFSLCDLSTIYIGDKWDTSNVTVSLAMFWECTLLVGHDGTTFKSGNYDISRAHANAGGYMTLKNSTYRIPYVVWCESNTTLYFLSSMSELTAGDTYNGQTITNVWREAVIKASPKFSNSTIEPNFPAWVSTVQSQATNVVIEESFQDVIITRTCGWFYDFEKLETITGVEYLNTSHVTSMATMFLGCKKLQDINNIHFDTSKVTDMGSMFFDCGSLTILDLSSFDTRNIKEISYMFCNCYKLKTVYIGDDWDVSNLDFNAGYGIFRNCVNLVGMDGTKYDSGKSSSAAAHANTGGLMSKRVNPNLAINNIPAFKQQYNQNALDFTITWANFSHYILSESLNNMTQGVFDELYSADCIENGNYQLKLFNFGTDIYGNGGTPPSTGYAQTETPSLGMAIYYPNGEGLTNNTFSWTLTKDEIDRLIKDQKSPIIVNRWICFAAKNANAAPYSYIWIKMTMEISFEDTSIKEKYFFGEKISNYWCHWNPNGSLSDPEVSNGWSAIVLDVEAPRDAQTIKDQRWTSRISNTLVRNYVNIEGKSKYYFAPKEAIQITAQNGMIYSLTPQNENNLSTYNKLFTTSGEQFKWDEATLEETLNNHAIIYGGEGAGVFNNDILYAMDYKGTYTPIVRLTQEQDKNDQSTWSEAGTLELIRTLPDGSTNTVLYDILNAIGVSNTANYSKANINKQLRAWLGYVKNDGNNVAQYVEQQKYDDDNKATFLVSWERPINLYVNETEPIKTEEQYIYLIDYLKLYDWRGDKPNYGYMYDDHFWFWSYYNVKEIDIDYDMAMTNLHQKDENTWAFLKSISTPLEFCPIRVLNQGTASAHVAPGTTHMGMGIFPFDLNDNNAIFTYSVNNIALQGYMGISPENPVNKARFGGIFYKINNEISESFSIIIPITVKYEWGSVKANFKINIVNPNGTKPNVEIKDNLSPLVFNIQAPSSGSTVKNAGWNNPLDNTHAMYFVNIEGKSKAYFAPKGDIKITAQNGKQYTITPQNNSNGETYNKLFSQSGEQFTWDETRLEQIMSSNTIIYEGEGAGVFNNSTLYAIDQEGNTTPIVRLNNEKKAGILELIRQLPDGGENEALYDVLNAIGYPGDIDSQLRTWIGYVKDDGNNVAQYVGIMNSSDDNKATFLVSWNRPINLNIVEPEPIKTQDAYLYLIDYLKPYDWQGDNFPNGGFMYEHHFWQWAYYNVKEIDVDLNPEHVMTNLRQKDTNTWVALGTVSTPLQLSTVLVENPNTNDAHVVPGTTNMGIFPFDLMDTHANFTYSVNNEALKAYMGISPENPIYKARFGGLYYNRNGENAKQFSFKVPVTMRYEWGSVTATMTINIENESGTDDKEEIITFTTSKGLTFEGNTKTEEATLVDADTELTGEVRVAEVVFKEDYAFTVTAIDREAFEGCTKIEKMELPKTVEAFAAGTLSSCVALKEIRIIDGGGRFRSVDGVLYSIGQNVLMAYPAARGYDYEIPATVTTIYDGAFANAQFTTLAVSWDDPNAVAVDNAAFEGVDFDNCSLSVPLGKSAVYRSHKVWGQFKNIVGEEAVIIDGSTYKLREDGTVAFAGPEDKNIEGDYVIPSTVVINGVEVPVTEIADGAFEGCTGLVSVTIPKSVERIGERAFKGCKNLEEVFSESPVPIDLKKMKKVRTRAGEEITQFEGINFETCILYVPVGSKEAYENAPGWNLFQHIVEYDPTNIRDIRKSSHEQDVYYNLQGQRITNPTKGLYIKNGRKVVVK